MTTTIARPDDMTVDLFYHGRLKPCSVTVWPTSGLGERLRMTASAFIYADKHQCSFQLGWNISKADVGVPRWKDMFDVAFKQPSEPYVRDPRHSVHTNQWLSRIQVTNGTSITFYGDHAFKMFNMDEEEYLRRKQQFYQLLTPSGSIFNASGYIGLHWEGLEDSDRSKLSHRLPWLREQLESSDADFFVVSSSPFFTTQLEEWFPERKIYITDGSSALLDWFGLATCDYVFGTTGAALSDEAVFVYGHTKTKTGIRKLSTDVYPTYGARRLEDGTLVVGIDVISRNGANDGRVHELMQMSSIQLQSVKQFNDYIAFPPLPQEHATSFVWLYETQVIKKVVMWKQYTPFRREICVLQILQQFDWCPRLLSYNLTAKTLTTSFVGTKVNEFNMPPSYRSQFQNILSDMQSVGVSHNDIFAEHMDKIDVMVKNEKLYLIDFGWASVNGSFATCDGVVDQVPRGWRPKQDSLTLIFLDYTMMQQHMPKPDVLPSTLPTSSTDILSDLGPLYHDYSFFGVHNKQLPGIFKINQQSKFPIIASYIALAVAKSKKTTESLVSFTELFCADGFYAMLAIKFGCQQSIGIDNDRDNYFDRKAKKIAKRLKINGITFLRGDITPTSNFETTDIVANIGGLYHVTNPQEVLIMSYKMAKKYLIVQTVVSLATSSKEYFESPAPGWTWGNRFSKESFDFMIRSLNYTIIQSHFNELEGNDRPEDRGSLYYLIEKSEDKPLLDLNEEYKPYRDATRTSGSQSETPLYQVEFDGTIRVRGYQQFDIKDSRVTAVHSYKNKFEWIRRTLMDIRVRTQARSLIDIGCSAGLISLLAQEVGYTEVFSLDHDVQYINMLSNIVESMDDPLVARTIHPESFSFGAKFPTKADVVVVGALIHWVFTCTANFGRFDKILDYLMTATSRVLIIEWVDPKDPAIQSFHHTSCGSMPQEPYEVSMFERALHRVGKITVKWALPTRPTRVFYVVKVVHT